MQCFKKALKKCSLTSGFILFFNSLHGLGPRPPSPPRGIQAPQVLWDRFTHYSQNKNQAEPSRVKWL